MAACFVIFAHLTSVLKEEVSWVVTDGRSGAMVMLCFLLSAAAEIIFLECGLNARWYNGLMFFL